MTHPTTFMPLCAGYAPLMGHHRHLLDDRVRTTAFQRALARVVRRGDVVADLGTGTGVLAIAARRRGASAVYAIERDPIVHVARAIAAGNGIGGITWLEGHSRDVVLPEAVDVIVSECFGVLAVGGTMIEAVCDLRARHLRAGGRVVPESVTIVAAPLESVADHRYVDAWSRRRYGLDFGAASALARNQPYNTTIAPGALLGPGVPIARIDLQRDAYAGVLDGAAELVARRAGTLHGFAAWFEAELGGGARLSTAPGRAATIWRQVFLPIAPVRVAKHARVELELGFAGGHFTWRGTASGRAFAHDTRASYPSATLSAASPGRAH